MDIADHYLHLARLVRANLEAANRGAYPATTDEWYDVARRLGVSVRCVAQLSFGGCLLDDLVIHGAGTPEQVARWMAHELAEERLRSECEPPYVLPAAGCRDHYHAIARLVETLTDGDNLPP